MNQFAEARRSRMCIIITAFNVGHQLLPAMLSINSLFLVVFAPLILGLSGARGCKMSCEGGTGWEAESTVLLLLTVFTVANIGLVIGCIGGGARALFHRQAQA